MAIDRHEAPVGDLLCLSARVQISHGKGGKTEEMPIHGLELFIEQLQRLDGLSGKDEMTPLNSAVCHHHVLQVETEAPLDRYPRWDLARPAQLSRRYHVNVEALYERVINSLRVWWEDWSRCCAKEVPSLRLGRYIFWIKTVFSRYGKRADSTSE